MRIDSPYSEVTNLTDLELLGPPSPDAAVRVDGPISTTLNLLPDLTYVYGRGYETH